MGICASNNNMGNSNKRAATEQLKTRKKKFKSAVSKYGPYKQSLDKEGNKTWSAPNNKEWPTFDKESDLRQWLLKHVSISDQNDQTIIRKQPNQPKPAQELYRCDLRIFLISQHGLFLQGSGNDSPENIRVLRC